MSFPAILIPMLTSMIASQASKPTPQFKGTGFGVLNSEDYQPQQDNGAANALQLGSLAGALGGRDSYSGFQNAVKSSKTTPNLPKGVKPIGHDIA